MTGVIRNLIFLAIGVVTGLLLWGDGPVHSGLAVYFWFRASLLGIAVLVWLGRGGKCIHLFPKCAYCMAEPTPARVMAIWELEQATNLAKTKARRADMSYTTATDNINRRDIEPEPLCVTCHDAPQECGKNCWTCAQHWADMEELPAPEQDAVDAG